jgi:hypothetical protein
MHDFTVLWPDCVGKVDCGSPNYAIILFISFYVVCTYIFVNLFTVVCFRKAFGSKILNLGYLNRL